MEEQNNQNNQKIKIMQLAKELADTQLALAKVNVQLAMKGTKSKITEKVSAVRKNLETQAKRMGANLTKVKMEYEEGKNKKGILEDYENALTEVNQAFDELIVDTLEKKSQLETIELELITQQTNYESEVRGKITRKVDELKDDILKATLNGKVEVAKEKVAQLQEFVSNGTMNELEQKNMESVNKRKEIRQMIEEADVKYLNYIEDRDRVIEEITEDTNSKLVAIPKQNVFQKVMGAVFSKFSGTKKFVQTEIKALEAKIEKIRKENLPQIKANVDKKRKEFAENVQNNVETYVKPVISKGKDTYKSVIERNYNRKLDIIKKTQEKLTAKQSEINKKIQELNGLSRG